MSTTLAQQTGELVALVREGHLAAFVDRVCTIPAADLADVLAALPLDARRRLVTALPARLAAHALARMARDAPAEGLLAALDTEQAARLVAELEDDDAADLLGRLSADHRQRILGRLQDSAALGRLLEYDVRSAGGMMTSHMVAVSELDPVGLAIEAVRRQAMAIGDLSEIFVVDTARRLTGLLSVKQLLLASPAAVVRDIMSPSAVHVGPNEDRHLVARVIARYGLTSVPVVNPAGQLLGRVTADDVRDVAVDEVTDDLLRFGGVSTREALGATFGVAVRSRLPSLYTSLLAAFGAATVVYLFQGSLLRIVSLAVWMPIVAGVGGNAGTQALATSVRRLVLDPARSRGLRSLVVREAGIGAVNGVVIGVIVAVLAVLLGESWKVGLVVLVAMIGNLGLAGAAGAGLPVLLKRSGRDPAIASPLFVTAATDAVGFALLFGLASVILL